MNCFTCNIPCELSNPLGECLKKDKVMNITKELLKRRGWIEKAGIMVRYSNPRIGWKEDGTLIIGYHEYPEKVQTIEKLNQILCGLQSQQ